MSTEIRKLVSRCTALRRAKDAIGREIDQLDAERSAGPLTDEKSARYDSIYADYDKLFDQVADLEDAILMAPATSRCDVIAKLSILENRAKLDGEVGEPIGLLAEQVRQWVRAEPVIWP